ncbi:hypothetical protein, partial [Nocardia cerradoensis]|uniref:hypothetical protein n=1 Tax=Nocardia cerradoensis TaxID=85688 RepID=UPI001C3F4102
RGTTTGDITAARNSSVQLDHRRRLHVRIDGITDDLVAEPILRSTQVDISFADAVFSESLSHRRFGLCGEVSPHRIGNSSASAQDPARHIRECSFCGKLFHDRQGAPPVTLPATDMLLRAAIVFQPPPPVPSRQHIGSR